MARLKKKKWSDYMWLVSATYFTLGFFNIVFAWLGVICFMIPLLMAVFGGGKGYCNNYCGRGQLFLQIGNTLGWSRKKVAPRWLSSKWFRHGFLLFFMLFFIQMINLTVMVANGAENLHQTIHLLWTFDVPWHWAYPVEIEPWKAQFAFGLYGIMLDSLLRGETDAGIAISDHVREGILEIPLYTEKFYVYLAESCWRKLPVFKPENLEYENMWIMKEAQCLRNSAFSFCKARGKGHHIYEAGSIETLIRIVDENGGFTIIPEMHLSFLSEEQKRNVRKIEGDYLSQRRISLYIREDYIRERMLNTLVDTLKIFIPKEMMGEGIRKYGIKL